MKSILHWIAITLMTFAVTSAGHLSLLCTAVTTHRFDATVDSIFQEETTTYEEETTEEITTEAHETYEDKIKVNIGTDYVVTVPINQFKSVREIDNGMQYEYKYDGEVKIFETDISADTSLIEGYVTEKEIGGHKIVISVMGFDGKYKEKLTEAIDEILNSVEVKDNYNNLLGDVEFEVESTSVEHDLEQ